MYLNNTRASTYEDCMRKGFYSFLFDGHGLEPDQTALPLLWGQAMHEVLAEHYRAERLYDSDVEAIRKTIGIEQLEFYEQEEWETTHIPDILRLADAYKEWAQDEFAQINGVEQAGKVPLGHSQHYWVYRIDLDVRLADGRRQVWDHKTWAGQVNDGFIRGWQHSFQLDGYCYGAQEDGGGEVSSYVVNVLRKLKQPDKNTKKCPACKQTKSRQPTCTECKGTGFVPKEVIPFIRIQQAFTQDRAERFVKHRLATIERIEDNLDRFQIRSDESAFPMNPKACFRWNRPCPFFDMCYQSKEWWNPEPHLLHGFKHREHDYVVLASEEML